MTNKELKNLLNKVKDAPEFGGAFDVGHKDRCWTRLCDELGFNAPKVSATPAYGFGDYAGYVFHTFSHTIMRPVAMAASVFVLILGGWITTVSASYNSLPGDVLYPVKLATERVQLTLATSTHKRASLHVEFAGRRLQEISELQEVENNTSRVENVTYGFKAELEQANEQLVKLQTSNPQDAMQIAVVLDQKSDEYGRLLGEVQTQANSDVKEAVSGARDAARESGTQAIRALVEQSEEKENLPLKESLQQSFQSKMTALKNRIALSLGRLAVVQATIEKTQAGYDLYARVDDAKDLLLAQDDERFGDAMNALAAGGYKKAFDDLAIIDVKLGEVEQEITQLEIDLTTQN